MPPDDGAAHRARAAVSGVRRRVTAPAERRRQERERAETRAERIALVRASGFLDPEWVARQLGRALPDLDAAIGAYLDAPRRCSPHPLFSAEWLEQALGRPVPKGANPLVWYLRRPAVHDAASPHPLLDLATLREQGYDGDGGPVVQWLRAAGPDSQLPTPLGSTTWWEVRDRSLAGLEDWRRLERLRTAPRQQPDPPTGLLEPGTTAAPVPAQAPEPAVSVVMPVWNRAAVLRRAVASVQAQTLGAWELLLVDDGSEDDSLAVARGLAQFDPRVVVVAEPHQGVSHARNAGLARARAPYVAFLDTDNVWQPGFLEVMVGALSAHEDWDMAHAALRASTGDAVYYRAHEGTHEELLVANHVDLNVLVARRDRVREVGGFDESLRRGVDYDLVLSLAERSALHLVPYVGVDYTDEVDAGPRISTSESRSWLSAIVARHLARRHGPPPAPTTGLTSVVSLVPAGLTALVDRLVALTPGTDLEVVLVGVNAPRWQHVLLHVLGGVVPGLRLVSMANSRGVAVALGLGALSARGEHVVLAPDLAGLDAAAARALAGALDDPAVGTAQPAVLAADGTVASAGADFAAPGRLLPSPVLGGHSPSDLPEQVTAVPAVLSPVLAVRASALAAVDGPDPMCAPELVGTDLSLRVGERTGLGSVLVPAARVVSAAGVLPGADGVVETLARWRTRLGPVAPPRPAREVWEAAGLEVVTVRNEVLETSDDAGPVLVPRAVVRSARAGDGLRWSVELPDGATPWLTDVAAGLAGALRDAGHRVSVDDPSTRQRPTRDLDDVVLALGSAGVTPVPTAVNLLWLLAPGAAPSGSDVVYAATTAPAGSVRTLLPPTGATYDVAPTADGPVLFLGDAHGVLPRSLRHLLDGGVPVSVLGEGWAPLVPDGTVLVDPEDGLGALAAARVVLVEQTAAERETGIVPAAVAGVAAAGVPVLTDAPLGDPDPYAGLVRTWTDLAELDAVVARPEDHFPVGPERADAAARVASEHSFEARVRTLLADARALVVET